MKNFRLLLSALILLYACSVFAAIEPVLMPGHLSVNDVVANTSVSDTVKALAAGVALSWLMFSGCVWKLAKRVDRLVSAK